MGTNDFRKLTMSYNIGFPLLGFFSYSTGEKQFLTGHHIDQAMLKRLTLPENCLSERVYMLACHDGMVLLYAQDEPKPLIWWDPIRGLRGT
jgi:hypothetical protein